MNRETKLTNHYLTIASLSKAHELANRMFMKVKHWGLWGSGLESTVSYIQQGANRARVLDQRIAVFRRKYILSST